MKAPPRWKDLGFRVDGGGAVGVGFAERPRVCSIMRVAMLHPLYMPRAVEWAGLGLSGHGCLLPCVSRSCCVLCNRREV